MAGNDFISRTLGEAGKQLDTYTKEYEQLNGQLTVLEEKIKATPSNDSEFRSLVYQYGFIHGRSSQLSNQMLQHKFNMSDLRIAKELFDYADSNSIYKIKTPELKVVKGEIA